MLTEREQFLAIVNNDILKPCDAIILLEGDGLNRYSHAANLYRNNISTKIIFSGNIVDLKYGSFPFSEIKPLLINAGVKESDIIFESKSLNTREQAVEIVKIAEKQNLQRIVLVASPEHQYRAYLTFLRVILDNGKKIVLYNSSASGLDWFNDEGWGERFNRLSNEFERIEKYRNFGHLASYSEAIDYQKWKEKQ